MNIKIIHEAETDIVIAISFYESQKDGLGKFFLDDMIYIYAILDCRKNPNSTAKRL